MQFGANTVIGLRVRLILMDCFETLVALGDEGYRPRRGVNRFLTAFVSERRVPVVVISDAPEPAIVGALRQAGLLPQIQAIYDRRAADHLGSGRVRKRLDLPLQDLRLSPQQAVFIGDSPLDAEASRHHQVPFIRVPRSEDQGFTFEQLISGPSRYRSGEFALHLANAYGPR